MTRLHVCVEGLSRSAPVSRQHRLQKRAAVASAQEHYVGSLSATGLKFALVVGRFNDLITRPLLQGALEAFERHGGNLQDADVSLVLVSHATMRTDYMPPLLCMSSRY